jgi:hypothetical protein
MRFSKKILTRLIVWGATVGAIAFQPSIARAQQAPAAADNKVTAIDISPVGASVYHLGNYGTAMVKLHSFKLKK